MTDSEENGVLTITIESDLFFPAAEKLGDQIMLYQELYKTKRVVLNLEKVDEMDSAAAQSIKSTIESSIKVCDFTVGFLLSRHLSFENGAGIWATLQG